MNLGRIKLIAIKEVHDHITSLRFPGLLFLLAALCTIQVLSEIGEYFHRIEYYNNAPFIAADRIFALSDLPYSINVFAGINNSIDLGIYGAVIAIALGFDLITKEREAGTIKTLLSVPVYRDEVINGKVLGGIIVIIIAVTVLFVIEFALLLLNSIVPGISEWGYFLALWIITILYLSGIFIMSVMISTFSRSDGMSLIFSLIAFMVLISLVPTIGNYTADFVISNPMDEYKAVDGNDPALHEMSVVYNEKKETIRRISSYLSFRMNYYEISSVLLRPQDLLDFESMEDYDRTLPPVGGVLASLWAYILFLVAYPLVFFGIAYVKFMRMDLR